MRTLAVIILTMLVMSVCSCGGADEAPPETGGDDSVICEKLSPCPPMVLP